MSRKISGHVRSLGFAVAAAAFLSVGAASVVAQDAVVMTDKPDYAPGEIAIITGAGFEPGETVTVEVDHADGTPSGGAGHEPWDVTADSAGGFTTSWYVDPDDSAWSVFLLTATGQSSGLVAQTTFTDASIGTYDQCSNDLGSGYSNGDTGCRWINGDLNKNNSRYFEGDATVQRVWLTGFVPGSTHTLRLEYGTTKGGKHAYDFLTTWNWSEAWVTVADRCQDIDGCTTAGETTTDIPQDANVPDSFEPSAPGDRLFTMRGGALNGATTPAIDSGSYDGDSETVITVSFTVDGSGPMCSTKQGVTTCAVALWFGGHVAAQANWGLGNGAGSISGSPYHVSLDRIDDGSIGQRDNQMQTNTVTEVPNGTIVIVKNALPDDGQDFSFNLNNNSTISQGFSLDDDDDGTLPASQTFSVPPGSWTASELDIPEPWSLISLVCSDPTNDTTVNGATATIGLASNETVTCTYTNSKDLCAGVVCSDTACSNLECDPADGQCKVASFSPSGTACGDTSAGQCDSPDTCDGAGTCQSNHASTGTTCGDVGTECTNQDLCDGTGSCQDNGYQAPGTACGSPDAGECDTADSCSGTGTCQPNHVPAGTTCGDAGTECTNQDLCDGSGACSDNGYQAPGTACGSPDAGECDTADSCSGTGTCQPNNVPAGTTCGDAGTECTNQDLCDGSGACSDNGYQAPGTACGDSTDTVCDNADSCNGAGGCQDNNEPATTECRAVADVCDVAELCDGVGSCPADVFKASTVLCNAGSGDLCDPDEFCTGNSAACPTDTVASNTTVCNAGSGDACDPDELCTGVADQGCPGDSYKPASFVCNPGSGDLCDPDEKCTGVPDQTCPNDTVASNTTVCNPGSGDACDPDELCTGIADQTCPNDVFKPTTFVCNAGSGDACDPDEFCTGQPNAACPADTVKPVTFVCNTGSGDVCDPDEKCTGVADQTCPSDTVAANTTVCNPGSGDPNNSGVVCDPDELCTGQPDTACPADTYASANTVCNAGSGDFCDPDEQCPGTANAACPADTVKPTGTQCRADSGLCDVAEQCSGVAGETCPADAREECAVVTSSSICTFNVTDACSGTGREFKLIYTPDAKLWPAYKLNGSNPGQYYYNLYVEGNTSVTVQIPWPFVTQGAMPVHVYSADSVTTTSSCINYPPGGEAYDLTITMTDRLNGKAAPGANGGFVDCPGPLSGLPGPPAPPDDVCTIQVPLPSTAGYFVAIHLDYGFKGLNVNANPVDAFADRYDKAANLNALVNTSDNTGAVGIPQCYAHNFCHATGSGGETGCEFTDVVRNANEFKKIAGVFGRLTDQVGGSVSGHVKLYRPSTGLIVGEADTDVDGFYTIPYKHTGSQETYQVQMTSTNPGYPGGLNANVVLKANGYGEVNFKWSGLAWIVVP